MEIGQNKKLIFFSHINGNFSKFMEIYNKIKEKSGKMDLIILTGNVFNKDKNFDGIKELEKLETKILIFDQSEVGIVIKHKFFSNFYQYSENIVILGRSGYYNFFDITIAYINGKENKKYLREEEKFIYTSSFFNKDDVIKTIGLGEKEKIDILLINTIPGIFLDEMIQ